MRSLLKKAQACNPKAEVKIFKFEGSLCFNWILINGKTKTVFMSSATAPELRNDPDFYILLALKRAKHQMEGGLTKCSVM